MKNNREDEQDGAVLKLTRKLSGQFEKAHLRKAPSDKNTGKGSVSLSSAWSEVSLKKQQTKKNTLNL